jgi:hypothetical protein
VEAISFSGISGVEGTKNQGIFSFKVSLNVYYQ